MIYITGDTHGDVTRFSMDNFPEQKTFTDQNENYVIICGDFGLVWNYLTETHSEKYWLNWLEAKKFTTLFVDGNHECINSQSDILTEIGWMNIVELYNCNNIKIANVDLATGQLSYDHPIDKIKKFSKKIIDIEGYNYKQSVTPSHDVVINGEKIKAKELIGKQISESNFKFKIKSFDYNEKVNVSPQILEILTAIVMDGTIVDYKKYNKNSNKVRIQFHLKKERKINYISNILDEANVKYTFRKKDNGEVYICIYGDYARKLYSLLKTKKQLPDYFRKINDIKQFKYILNAIVQTDGSTYGNRICWRTTSKNDVDIIQELCMKFNYDIHVKMVNNGSGYKKNCKVQYFCSIGENKQLCKHMSIIEREYNDYVYCFVMPKGTLITRYNNGMCITGNCHPRLADYPVKEWNGGLVHEIRPHVLHLMRGQVFNIDGCTIFTFGGARSHDIDNLLDLDDPDFIEKQKQVRKDNLFYRVKGISWWEEEMPTQEEMQIGLDNLENNNWKVDYIITHDCTSSTKALYSHGSFTTDELNAYLEEIRCRCEFKKWFFGHLHGDKQINDKEILLYHQIVRIW